MCVCVCVCVCVCLCICVCVFVYIIYILHQLLKSTFVIFNSKFNNNAFISIVNDFYLGTSLQFSCFLRYEFYLNL